MAWLREIRLAGGEKKPASINFGVGANVVAGASDTGKSYMINCLDFVLGADEMKRALPEAKPYTHVLLELENADNARMTLKRDLTGGDIEVYHAPIRTHEDTEPKIALAKRQGRQIEYDVTSAVFEFLGIDTEIQLRKNAVGETQRLTVRTLLPAFVVDETKVIAEKSPLYGVSGYGNTASQRMFSFLLTGKDDRDVIAAEKLEKDRTELAAKLDLARELHLESSKKVDANKSIAQGVSEAIEAIESSIDQLTSRIDVSKSERRKLQTQRRELVSAISRRETQRTAQVELLTRYHLLAERYESDLNRLDFISEGAHYLGSLQHAVCAYCGQEITDKPHDHDTDEKQVPDEVYNAAVEEASKIKGLQKDLVSAVEDLSSRLAKLIEALSTDRFALSEIDEKIDAVFIPEQQAARAQVNALVDRRLLYSSVLDDVQRRDELADVCARLEKELEEVPQPKARKWAGVDEGAITEFCRTIEAILTEWSWPGDRRVEFDQKKFDIKVDGKPRQSHGKGVRSVLHAAFTIALLRYCESNDFPHPGFVIIDSPLTTFKQGEKPGSGDEVDSSVEASFWKSLQKVPKSEQIIVLENKEPPTSVSDGINYHYFSGPNGAPGSRKGFVETD